MAHRILILKPTALGDVAMALQVVPTIKEQMPDCFIGWVVDESYAPLVAACKAVDELIAFPRARWRKGFHFAEIGNWARTLKARGYETSLDLQGLARTALMSVASGATRRIGLESAREWSSLACTELVADRAEHAVDRYWLAIEHLTGGSCKKNPHVLDGTAFPRPEILGEEPYIVLHPYSMWDTKLWPWENYGKLAQRFPDLKFVLVGNGPLFPVPQKNVLDMRNRTPLPLLLSLLAHARKVVTTDSGPAHLAALMGTPVTTLFGASDPRRTRPYGKGHDVVWGEVECRPCLSRKCENSREMLCMKKISLEPIVQQILKLL